MVSELIAKAANAPSEGKYCFMIAYVFVLAVVVGVIESMFAKLRLFRLTDLLVLAFILSLLALVFFYILRGGTIQ
mgnify:CR=1 FL=1